MSLNEDSNCENSNIKPEEDHMTLDMTCDDETSNSENICISEKHTEKKEKDGFEEDIMLDNDGDTDVNKDEKPDSSCKKSRLELEVEDSVSDTRHNEDSKNSTINSGSGTVVSHTSCDNDSTNSENTIKTDNISKKSRLKRGAEDSAPDMSHDEDSDSENPKTKPGSEHLVSETNMSCDDESSNSENSSHSEKRLVKKKKKDGYEEDIIAKEDIGDFKMFQNRNLISRYGDYADDEDSDLAALALSDTEDTVLDQLHRDPENKPKRKKPLRPFELHFVCEWKNCSYETDEDSKFHVHVSYHIPDLEIKTLANGEEVYMCLWGECNFLTGGVKEIQRHVTYHSYHTKLKNIGTHVIKEWNLPTCMYGTETRNLIPDKIDPMICEWKDCSKEFNNVQVFLHHIQMHVNENFLEHGTEKQNIRCKWEGCTLYTQRMERTTLTNHVRTHTQEKVVGCPTCGHLFATNTKLIDHCERQLPQEMSEFQCSHCYKHFPSIRLLKDHMRGHVNFYKCCYCDMTCSSRHTFSAHIRYKHLDSKPFRCNMCDYECKTHFDLKAHLPTHDPKPQFACEEDGCEFTCRAKRTLQRHMTHSHTVSSSPIYACHLPDCNSKYKRGSYLTKHLMTKHCLRWPSGHSKFMYHRQEDGTYRLQTVRYESIKMNGENKSLDLPSKSNFKITPHPGEGTRSFKVSAVELESDSSSSQVLISIEDESGNTINCCTAPQVLGDKIPKNATVIASADSDMSSN